MAGPEVAAAAVASLPAMTPQRLAKIGRSTGDLGDADWTDLLACLRAGGEPAVRLASAALTGRRHARTAASAPGSAPAGTDARRLAEQWAAAATAVDLVAVAERHAAADVAVLVHGAPGYPAALAGDGEAPAVLFRRGRADGPGPCTVAIVGTRSATHYGTGVAAELGAGLAARGVSVVSGLATGVDAAAHEGALAQEGIAAAGATDAPDGAIATAVVGAGLDVVYPTKTARLRQRLEERGTVLSEAPLGAAPERWRFPLRNRVIAALAQVVVVVESHAGGGALHTVESALARGREVMAVPGSVRSPASAGTNGLIAAGAHVVTSVDDVLVALARLGAAAGAGPFRPPPPAAASLDPLTQAVLGALEDTPLPTQEILGRTGADLGEVALALEHLAAGGRARDYGGAWARQ